MAKKKQSIVSCRYPKCSKIHESNKMPKENAIRTGSGYYYHPDCYHTMQTVNEIRDLFVKEIDPTLTGKQIGALVSIINNIIFEKKVSVDFLKFAVQYFIKYKPGSLKYPPGLNYIIQDNAVKKAWKTNQTNKSQEEIRTKQKLILDEFQFDLPDMSKLEYKPKPARSFADILG